MRDINRIDIICTRIAELWKTVPDWRFMQLLVNFQEAIGSDGFYLEDERFISLFEEWISITDEIEE